MKPENTKLNDFIIEYKTLWRLQKVVYFFINKMSIIESCMSTTYVVVAKSNKYFLSKRYFDCYHKHSSDFYLVARKVKQT